MAKNIKKVSKFIAKLLQILQDQTFREIIRWNQDGTGILIKNRKQLELKVVNQYFKLKKVASFIRQLHLYGFHKTKSLGKANSFEHPLFVKDDKADYSAIKRKRKENHSSSPKKSQQSINQDTYSPIEESVLPELCEIKSFKLMPKDQQEHISIENIFQEWFFKNDDDYSFNLDDCMN